VTSKDSGAASILELPTMKVLTSIDGMDNSLDISSVTMTHDHANVVQINNNGAMFFIGVTTKDLVLSGRYIDDEVVLFDPKLNYESTPEGAAYVYVRVPGSAQLYTLDQLSNKLNLPGVGSKRIAEASPTRETAFDFAPPYLDVERREKSYTVRARSQSGLSRLIITIDGLVVREAALNGLFSEEVVSADALPSGRWINFVVEDKQGLRSVARAFSLSNRPYPGRLSVLASGLDKFFGGHYAGKAVSDLSFAVSDARRFEAGIKRLVSPAYSSYTSTLLAGAQVSKQAVLSAIRRQAEMNKKGETFILFLASHGVSDQHEVSVVFPGQLGERDVNILPFSAISDALRASQGRVFVFLDVCHSADASPDIASEQLVSGATDITIIIASKGMQSSLENSSWGGGVFTTAVVSTLESSKGSKDQNGLVGWTVEELYAGVRRRVIVETGGRQTPWLRRSEWRGAQSIN
jgi:hypothetical protein